MSRTLDQAIVTQQSNQAISAIYTFKINGIDFSSSLISWQLSYNTDFGSASGSFLLNNNNGVYGEGGTSTIKIGDIVELFEQFSGSTLNFKSFYGKVEQRVIVKDDQSRTIQLTCLDYISILQHWDVDLFLDSTKVEVLNEILVPQFLSPPNNMLASVFNFSNDAIAQNPPPVFTFRDKMNLNEDPQSSGYTVEYQTGQVLLGTPLNARDNYSFVAVSYSFYPQGLFCEDVLETLLTQTDGYGNYLFNEPNAQSVINNHLVSDLNAETGSSIDILTANPSDLTLSIYQTLTSPTSAGDTFVILDSVDGLPTSGSAKIAGNTITWTSIVGLQLHGVTGLLSHPSSVLLEYTKTYSPGYVWNLTYSNLYGPYAITKADFTVPGATAVYLDKRNGFLILNNFISTSAIVTCNTNYSFKTLQSSGVQINNISLRARDVNNLYDAITKLREYLAPNYVIRTQGDNKIWSSYLYQKVKPDYTLNLIKSLNYMEDPDLYTRVILYRQNINPSSLLFKQDVNFSIIGTSYTAITQQTELNYDSTDAAGMRIYKSVLTGVGRILLDTITPLVYINNALVDNQLHNMQMLPVKIIQTTLAKTESNTGKPGDLQTYTFIYYVIRFPLQNLVPSQPIYLYDEHGSLIIQINPHDPHMDYANGLYNCPGNVTATNVQYQYNFGGTATATFWVLYSTNDMTIDYDTSTFKFNSTLIPDPNKVTVTATFEYFTSYTPSGGLVNIIDGRQDTQLQTEFYAEPPAGYEFAILDLGSIQTVQTIDIEAGFYQPTQYQKFDVDFRFTLKYSLDGTHFYEISDQTHNIEISGGATVTFDENALGAEFKTRYFMLVLEYVKKLDYGSMTNSAGVVTTGVWPVAITELSAYSDIVVRSEAKLIPTTQLTSNINGGDTVINVVSTANFTDPGSGEVAYAYINGFASKEFTYTGLTATSFVGVTLISGCSGLTGQRVSQTLESTTTIYDDAGLLSSLGDRIFKEVKVDKDLPYSQVQLDQVAKNDLKEYYKNHSKVNVDVLFSPYIKVGDTVRLIDTYNDTDRNYFVQAIADNSGLYTLTLAYYP